MSSRQKIAILGGGVGAMTTAYYLTQAPDWQDKYDITVYQLGWRLGGKGASGRGAYGRIEEHGLHMWYGFYENAFRLIQDCYGALGRSRGEPLSTWEEAFKPQSFTVYQEQVNGRWIHWPMQLPINDETPGQGGEIPSTADFMLMMLQWITNTLLIAQQPEGPPPPTNSNTHSRVRYMPWWEDVVAEAERKAGYSVYHFGVLTALSAAKILANPEAHHALLMGNSLDEVQRLLADFSDWLHELLKEFLDKHDNLRRLYIMVDLVGTTLRGLIADKVRSEGLSVINNQDYAQWLIKHGANQSYTVPFVYHNLYDQAFAFEDGDCTRPNFAAGVVVYTAMRTYFTYKGAFLWKMQAGMGDTIFGPFYQLLKKRGVTFKFFRRVENLHLDGDGRIGKVSISRQVDVKPEVETKGGYDPLVTIKGLPCWPAEPLYDQLVQGEELKAEKIDLESYWTPWHDVGSEILVAGEDYDLIVLGISLGALPYVARELIAASPNWQDMVHRVKTTQTQAFQLWFKPDDAGLGWPMWRQQPATLTGYDADDNPEQAGLDTWGDFSHLIIREDWPSRHYPNNIAYLCGAMLGPNGLELPPRSDHDFPDREAARVKVNSIHFLKNYVQHLWPDATQRERPQELDWELLVDTQQQEGEARFDSQFWRANIDPSERYVLCVADSAQFRLSPGDSKFANLYLSGDWTNNGMLSLGCVESAVIGGLQAANAILPQFGYRPTEIIGWDPL